MVEQQTDDRCTFEPQPQTHWPVLSLSAVSSAKFTCGKSRKTTGFLFIHSANTYQALAKRQE